VGISKTAQNKKNVNGTVPVRISKKKEKKIIIIRNFVRKVIRSNVSKAGWWRDLYENMYAK
jgi:hypothetical protein